MRQTKRELVMSRAEFASADYGQLCQTLGLRPSQPHHNAAGKDARKGRPRRRQRPAK